MLFLLNIGDNVGSLPTAAFKHRANFVVQNRTQPKKIVKSPRTGAVDPHLFFADLDTDPAAFNMRI